MIKNKLTVEFTVKITTFLTLIFIFSPLFLKAQEETTATTLFSNKAIRIGGYGAFEAKFSQIDGGFTMLVGGRGGVILNSMFSIGGAGYGIIPMKEIDCPIPSHATYEKPCLTGGYGGLFLEYINSSNNLLHFTANLLIGAGGVTYVHDVYDYDYDIWDDHSSKTVFVLEPGIAVDLNVASVFRMSLGVSYRYSPNFKLQYSDSSGKHDIVSNTAFNGISANLVFKFGEF